MFTELKKPIVFRLLDDCGNEKFKNLMKKLLYKHPKELYRIWEGNTVYNYALLKRNGCLEKLHEIYLKIKNELEYPPYNIRGDDGVCPVHLAVKNNMLNELNFLINEVGVNVNKQDIYGNTPLHLSVKNGSIQTFNILMSQSKPDINILNDDGKSILYIAVQIKNKNMINTLLKKGAFVTYKVGDFVYNITDMVKGTELEDFMKGIIAKETRKYTIKTIPKPAATHLKYMMDKYKELCLNLDLKVDHNKLINLGKRLNIKSPKNIPKEELCKKISYKIMFYKTNPDLLSKSDKIS